MRLTAGGGHVLVTARHETARRVATALRRSGLRAVTVPTIATVAVPDIEFPDRHGASNRGSRAPEWIVFVSPAAVHHAGYLAAGGAAPHARIAAIGPATAATLRRIGIQAAFVGAGDSCDGETFAAMLPLRKGEHVILPRSNIAGHAMVEILRDRGADVRAFVAYRTNALAVPRLVEVMESVDAVAFLSPSAVAATVRSVSRARVRELLTRTTNACIGPTTARAAHAAGIPVHVVGAEYTADGLVRALLRNL